MIYGLRNLSSRSICRSKFAPFGVLVVVVPFAVRSLNCDSVSVTQEEYHSEAHGQQAFATGIAFPAASLLSLPSTSAYLDRPVPGSSRPWPLCSRTALLSLPIAAALHPYFVELPEGELRGILFAPSTLNVL